MTCIFLQTKLYHDKQNIPDELFYQFHPPLLKKISSLIYYRMRTNIDSDAYKKYKQRYEATIKEERN